jgi:hypothetical protein
LVRDCRIEINGSKRRLGMKNVAIAILLAFGVSVSGSVFACDDGSHHKTQSGISAPATPAPVK